MLAIPGTRRQIRELVDRFLAKTVQAENGCIEWTGCIMTNGYGAIQANGEKRGAHRVAYELFVGEIPCGMFVCHKCDNKRCVNPEHLFVGSAKDNAQDRAKKGRGANQLGDKGPRAKLIGNSRVEAKHEWLHSTLTGAEVAKRWGMTEAGMIRAFGPRGRKKGEAVHGAKLTADDVRLIRARLASNETIASLAREFGIAWQQVKRIKIGESWRHV